MGWGPPIRSPGPGQEDGYLRAAPSARICFGPALHTSCQLCSSLSQCVPLLVLSQLEDRGPLEQLGLAIGPFFSLSCNPVTFEDTGLGPFPGKGLGVARAVDTCSLPRSMSKFLSSLFLCASESSLLKFQSLSFNTRARAFK